MKWMKQNKLDEMQEMKLSMIEKRGCWFAFWALLAVMAVQLTIFKATPAEMAGECESCTIPSQLYRNINIHPLYDPHDHSDNMLQKKS